MQWGYCVSYRQELACFRSIIRCSSSSANMANIAMPIFVEVFQGMSFQFRRQCGNNSKRIAKH